MSPQLYNLTPSVLILVAGALPRSNWAPLTYPTDIPVWPNGNRGPQDRVRGTRVPSSPSLLEFVVSAMAVQGHTGVTAHVGLWCMAKEKSPPGVCALYELIPVHMTATVHPNPAGKRHAHSRSSCRSKGGIAGSSPLVKPHVWPSFSHWSSGPPSRWIGGVL